MLIESIMKEEEGKAMKENDQNGKGFLDVMYLIVCEYCGRVKWCNKWVHFSEVDKKELRRREVYRKVVTCKDCTKLESRNVDLIDQRPTLQSYSLI